MRKLVNNKPIFQRINHIIQGVNEYRDFNGCNINIDSVNLDDRKNDILDLMIHPKIGFHEFFVEEIKEYKNISKHIVFNGKYDENIYIKYTFDKENTQLIDYNLLEFSENSEATVVIVFEGDNDRYYHNGALKIIAHPNSKVKIVVVQLLSNKSENYYTISLDVLQNATVDFYSACFGADINALSVRANLLEEKAECNIVPVYFADDVKKMDLEYTLRFYGKYCKGIIDARGVTKDDATKVFRGNLIFEKGSTKSEGEQSEFSILLSKTMKAHSIPTLFCREDDVLGAHSANVGKINQDKLLYLMSRGLTEKQSKKLVILSSISPVLSAIDDEKLQEKILLELDERV